MPPISAERIPYEEFLRAYDGRHAEWVKGEVIAMSPVSSTHQAISIFIAKMIDLFLEYRALGKIRTAPYAMRLKSADASREPDVMFISNERLHALKEGGLEGPCDIAVEVISPDSRARDRGDKFYEYEQEGVREYWLIDPARKRAEFYALGADKTYNPMPLDGDVFRSEVLPGFWLKVEWLWRDSFPGSVELLKGWGLI